MTTRRVFLRASAALPLTAWSWSALARADDDPGQRAKSVNNLKQIALAFHNYHDQKGSFPPAATVDGDGKPLLSWRVAILPYIEGQALYDEFHKDEPWDSEHNKALLEKMPAIYAPVVEKEGLPANSTYYQGFTGTKGLFEGNMGPRLADITDGTSNTLMVVEADSLVPWTKPVDLVVDDDLEKPLPKVGGQFEEGFNAAFCDGSVRFFKKDIDPEVLRKLITRNGGEVINANDF